MVIETPSNQKVRVLQSEAQPPLARLCQTSAVIISLLIAIVAPLLFGAVENWVLGPIWLAIAVATALWLVRLTIVREIKVVFSPVAAAVLVFAAYGFVRYGLADFEPIARQGMLLSLSAALLFFLVLNNLRPRWHLTALVWIISSTAAFVAAYGLWQLVRGAEWVWWFPQYDDYVGRASGTFIRPNHFAAFLQIAFPITAANFFFSRRSYEGKVVLASACLIIGAALLFSFAPNGWLGWLASVIVLGVYLIKSRGRKFRWLVLGASLLGAVLIIALTGLNIFREPRAEIFKTSESSRIPLWRSAWQQGRDNPFLGNGPGMYRWLFPSYRTLQGQPESANNEYLTLFAEYGLIGCLLLVWVTVTYVMTTVQILAVRAQRYSASTPANRYAFAVGGLASFAAIAVGSIFDSSMRAPANLYTLAIIMAAVLTCGVHPSGKLEQDVLLPGRYTTVEMKGVTKWVLIGALGVVLGLFASGVRRTYPSDLLFRMAEREKANLNWSAAEQRYTQAWKLDRRNYEVTAAFGDYFVARATWNTAQRQTLLNEALSWYERALTTNPFAVDILIKMARVYDALGKREQASERYSRALKADPDNSTYHAQLALHHKRWGETDKAAASFLRAHQLGGAGPMPAIQLKRIGKLTS